MNLFLFLVFANPGWASSSLSDSAGYAVKKELHAVAPDFRLPESFAFEQKIDLDSVDPDDAGSPSLYGTHTEQLTKVKKLPKLDPKDAPKDGYLDRSELSYERFFMTSQVRVPGLARPFETRVDLSPLLATKTLVIRGDGKAAKVVDNLGEARADLMQKAGDAGARMAVGKLLDENELLRMAGKGGESGGCQSQLTGKKPGDKWQYTYSEGGLGLDTDCTFGGWSEADGKKVAVIKVHSPKRKATKLQPNGVPGVVETEIDGSLVLEPVGRESLQKMVTVSTAEPTEDEVSRLKAKGQKVPRNRTTLSMVIRIYGI